MPIAPASGGPELQRVTDQHSRRVHYRFASISSASFFKTESFSALMWIVRKGFRMPCSGTDTTAPAWYAQSLSAIRARKDRAGRRRSRQNGVCTLPRVADAADKRLYAANERYEHARPEKCCA